MGRVKEKYPLAPGYKEETTSKDAAKGVKKKSANLRVQVLDVIGKSGFAGLTADEAAEKIGETINNVRPRITELKQLDKIEPTGHRRPNVSGAKAICWRIKP